MEKIEEILNEYRGRCVYGKKIGISEKEAIHSIRQHYIELLPKERNTCYFAGYNSAIAEMKSRIESDK